MVTPVPRWPGESRGDIMVFKHIKLLEGHEHQQFLFNASSVESQVKV